MKTRITFGSNATISFTRESENDPEFDQVCEQANRAARDIPYLKKIAFRWESMSAAE